MEHLCNVQMFIAKMLALGLGGVEDEERVSRVASAGNPYGATQGFLPGAKNHFFVFSGFQAAGKVGPGSKTGLKFEVQRLARQMVGAMV